MNALKLTAIMILLSGLSYPDDNTPDPQSFERILIINSFDAQSLKARKNKKLLFGELADSLKQMIYAEMDTRVPAERIVIPEIVVYNGNDSIYFELIRKHSATKAIVIQDLDAFFDKTGVTVTREGNQKDREASYDIVAEVDYYLYNDSKRMKEFHTKVREFFTTRDVVSGLLAAGPDIVGKHKHAYKIVQKNAKQFVRDLDVYLQKSNTRQ